MKKPRFGQKAAQQRHARRRQKHRSQWLRWKKAKRIRRAQRHRVIVNDGSNVAWAWANEKTAMPTNFCLDENFDETIAFLAPLRTKLLEDATKSKRFSKPKAARFCTKQVKRVPSYIDFSSMKRITTTAALILAAYYDRRKFISGRRLSTVDENNWNPEVVDVLLQLGFKELLELKERASGFAHRGHSTIIQFVSGQQADGPILGRLQEALLDLLPPQERALFEYIEPYGGIMEAILNSYAWAYPDGHVWDFPPMKRWWITGSVNADDMTITVAAYDQGISIPASLPRWKHFGRLERLMRRALSGAGLAADLTGPENDGIAIQLAMKIAKTATGLPQHGKGLHTMLEVAQRAPWGRLRVLSRNGEYLWVTGRKPVSRSHKHSIGGTLVEWHLRLR